MLENCCKMLHYIFRYTMTATLDGYTLTSLATLFGENK